MQLGKSVIRKGSNRVSYKREAYKRKEGYSFSDDYVYVIKNNLDPIGL